MKNIILLLISSVFLVSTSYAQEQLEDNCSFDAPLVVKEDKFYVKAVGGANFIETGWSSSNYQTGYLLSGALGYRYNYGINLEVECSFRKNSYKYYWNYVRTSSTNTSSCIVNALWDIPTHQDISFKYFQPFVGFGLGADFHNTFTPYFAWQFIFGIKRPINSKIDILLEYVVHRRNQSIGLGLTYKFGNGYGY